MNLRKLLLAVLTVLFYLLFAGGVAGYTVLDEVPTAASWAGPMFLYTAFAIVLLSSERKMAGWLGAAFAGGIVAELIGLHTGLLFGDYTYSAALGGQLLGVPVAIGAAWGVLLAYASALSMLGNRFTGAAVGALWMVVVDLLIDPLASGPLGYWHWHNGGAYFGIPLANFAGWFIVSFILLSFMPRGRALPGIYRLLGLSVAAFYGLIALAHTGLQVVAVIAVLLIIADSVIQLVFAKRGLDSLSGFGKMTPAVFIWRTNLPVPAIDVFRWHEHPGAFEVLKPPWQKITIARAPGSISTGEQVSVILHFGPVSINWISEIIAVTQGRTFIDEQVSGPWTFWRHEHNFIADGDHSCVMEDRVEYAVPIGVLGDLLGGWLAEYELHRLFSYRHEVLKKRLTSS